MELLAILLTTGVISSLITSIVTLVVCIKNNRTTRGIAEMQINQEVISYRYTRLMTVREKLTEIGTLSFNETAAALSSSDGFTNALNRIAEQTQARLEQFERAAPLFDKSLRQPIDDHAQRIQDAVRKVRLGDATEEEVISALKGCDDFANMLELNLETQLSKLLRSTDTGNPIAV